MRANWQLHGFLIAVLMERNGTAMPQARGKTEVEAKRAERTPALPHGQPRAWAFGEMEKAAGEATDGNGRKNGARCDGKCSALQWATQRGAMTDAACCIFLSTFTGNPEQSALISPPAYSSTQINRPSHRHRLSSAHLPAHVSSLTSTSYVLLKPQLLSQPAHSSSTACTLVFPCLHARFPLPAHLFSTAKSTCLPLPVHLPPHCQSICLPPTTQSPSTTRTFGFLCQHACLPLPARSASPVRTLVIRSQPNHPPNRPVPLIQSSSKGSTLMWLSMLPLQLWVPARQAPVRCGGKP